MSEDGRHGECSYCHRRYEYESGLTDDKSIIDYEQATEYWHTFRFADAKRKFLNVANANPEFSEAWWGAFVSEYGIEFVTNKFGGQIPTCHRAHTVSVFDDENYKKAVESADDSTKQKYHELGEKIENIRKGIIEKSNADEIYDIFICFKATEVDDDRRKTIDYDLGREIYSTLNKEGYRVFFAPETLLQVAEQEYEPYIYRALSTAKVMFLLCSDNREIESAWVKNEWSRFLDMHNGQGLIPICGNKFEPYSPNSLPEELRKLNAIEYNGRLFEQLLTKIRTYFPKSKQKEVLTDCNKNKKSSTKKSEGQNHKRKEYGKTTGIQNKELDSLPLAVVNNEAPLICQYPEYDSNNYIAYTESKADELEKQYNINSQAQSLIDVDKKKKFLSLSLADKCHILLNCIVCLSVLSLIVGWLFGWNVYQWIVGISTSIIFLKAVFYISEMIDLETLDSENVVECIELCLLVVVNYVLYFTIQEKYVVVGYFISGVSLLFGVIAAVKAHHNDKGFWMVVDILACVFTLLLIVIMIVGWAVFIECVSNIILWIVIAVVILIICAEVIK